MGNVEHRTGDRQEQERSARLALQLITRRLELHPNDPAIQKLHIDAHRRFAALHIPKPS